MKNTLQSQLCRATGGAFASWSRSRMRSAGSLQLVAATTALTALVGFSTAKAADVTFDFDKGQPAGVQTGGNNEQLFRDTGGNPGGFLALTYPVGSQSAYVVFDNTDPGKVVTGFSFSADLRVGNPSTDRAADGFSISFARDGDPFLTSLSDADFGGNCCFETGTKTGIAVSFDTWSGNTFPTDLGGDTADIEGIIVRVDNRTVKKTELPTRNGSADDITSLQTGPRDTAYWPDGDPYDPGAWAGLQWRKFAIDLTPEGKLTVTWKGNKVLDNFQTAYFPTAGQLVFAGRTGGANENTHVDNIRLVTIAQVVSGVPDAPANFKVAQAGSHRVQLSWDAATVPGDPSARVTYTVERDGEVIAPLVTDLTYTDRNVQSGKSYTYKVTGKNIAGNPGASSTVTATTVTDVPGVAFLKAEQWSGINGGVVADALADPHLADPPDAVHFINGLSFGETSNFGNTWGENFLASITGVLTVPEAGSYRFFVRSDDGSALYLNLSGATIPDPNLSTPVAVETGCCGAFEEVGAGANPDDTFPTSEPIALTAGQKVGIAFLVKEGGGGDWGQVAWRKEGDTTPASQLTPIRGDILASPVDAVGATVAISKQPVGATVNANEATSFSVEATGSSFYEADYGKVLSYQWYKNGKAILGANAATYNIPVVLASDANAKIKVVVAVAGAAVTSDEVTLVVNPDVAPPTVASITVLDAYNTKVVFSEPVKDPSATALGNYTFTGLTVASVVRNSDRSVTVTTSKHTPDTDYPVTINGVLDNADKPSAYTGKIHSFKLKAGAQFSRWNNETGGFETFGTITRPADSVETVTEFYSGRELADNYFGRLQAIFTPATSGNYVFFCSSDDHGELYLSTDANPTNKKKIAQEPEWSNPKYWIGDGTDADANTDSRIVNGDTQNRSDSYAGSQWAGGPGPIALTAGTQYYIEFLYKEGGGGDSGSATFVIGSGDPVNGETTLKGDLLSWYEAASVAPPEITGVVLNPDGTITLTWTGTGTLEAGASLNGPFAPVAGATSPYTFTPTEAMLFGRVVQ